jgi:hypothetical protein
MFECRAEDRPQIKNDTVPFLAYADLKCGQNTWYSLTVSDFVCLSRNILPCRYIKKETAVVYIVHSPFRPDTQL